jgi:hypothetical protein
LSTFHVNISVVAWEDPLQLIAASNEARRDLEERGSPDPLDSRHTGNTVVETSSLEPSPFSCPHICPRHAQMRPDKPRRKLASRRQTRTLGSVAITLRCFHHFLGRLIHRRNTNFRRAEIRVPTLFRASFRAVQRHSPGGAKGEKQ